MYGGKMIKKRILAMFVLCCVIFSGNAIKANEVRSKYKYSIDVNTNQNIVTVYELDKDGGYTIPNRAFVCSVGEGTPLGSFKTSDRYEWRELFGNVYGQYATRITGHILFHSVPYKTMNKNDLEYDEYNKLGTTASMGCVRLCVKDAKWIYENCPSGTSVNISDNNYIEPLPKPAAYNIDLSDTDKLGWDPTDTDLSNPYLCDSQSYAPSPSVVLDLAGMNINGNMFYSRCYNVNGSNYFKINDIERIFKLAGIPFSYDYADTNQAEQNILRVNTSDAPRDSDCEKLLQAVNGSNEKTVFVLYGNQTEFLNVYSLNGENYYNIRDIAKFSQLNVSWDEINSCIELQNSLTT